MSNNIDKNRPQSVSFSSHSKRFKAVDDFARFVGREFPVCSNTRLERYKAINNTVLYKVYRYAADLIGEIRGFSSQAKSPVEYISRRISSVKKLKVGNCSELSDATAFAFKLNGFKNAESYSLHAYNTATGKVRTLDHTVVGIDVTRPMPKAVNSKKDFFGLDNGAIIVDPWAGFVDNERSASAIYKHNNNFRFKMEPDEIIVYSPTKYAECSESLSEKDILYFKHKFPELLKNKKFGLWDRLVWRFMDKSKYEFEEFPIGVKEALRRNANLKSALTQEELSELLNKRG